LLRREAELVALPLIELIWPVPDVLEHIRANTSLSEAARQRALAIAEAYHDDPRLLDWASRIVAASPAASSAMYCLALRQAEAARRLDPREPAHLTTLAMAQYRVGRYEDAVKSLMVAPGTSSAASQPDLPANLAFLAMAQHQLGHKNEAQAALQSLCATVRDPRCPEMEAAHAYLSEAEALLKGQTTGVAK
jgi:hypothetical protein